MRIFLISFFTAYSFIGKAQDKHHVFIQAVQPKLFVVEYNNSSLLSSSSGLFFLSDLNNPNFYLNISFPPASFPIYQFKLDASFLDHVIFLEQLADSTWQLNNANNHNRLIAKKINNPSYVSLHSSGESKDIFLNLLSNAVDDQEIRHSILIERTDIPLIKNSGINNIANIVSTTNAAVIKLIYRNKNNLIFTEKSGNIIDTIKVDIPLSLSIASKSVVLKAKDKIITAKSSSVDSVNSSFAESQIAIQQKEGLLADKVVLQKSTDSVLIENNTNRINQAKSIIASGSVQKGNRDSSRIDKQSIKNLKDTSNVALHAAIVNKATKGEDQSIGIRGRRQDSVIVTKMVESSDSIVIAQTSAKNNCRHLADERDLILFRKKMILMNNQSEVISFAAKEFKQKCYTTIGIRNLSFIFLNDKDKLQFFELAYINVYDPENFATLERFLNDEEEINKFRSLIKN